MNALQRAVGKILRLITYRCDVCSSTAELSEFPPGTLFGRTMRLCDPCAQFLGAREQIEREAAGLDLGIPLDLPAGAGLRAVEQLEETGNLSPAQTEALCRLRFHFQRRLNENS